MTDPSENENKDKSAPLQSDQNKLKPTKGELSEKDLNKVAGGYTPIDGKPLNPVDG